MVKWKKMTSPGNELFGYEKGNWGVTLTRPDRYNADYQMRALNYKTNERFTVPGNRLAEISHDEFLRKADYHIGSHNRMRKLKR